MKDNICFCIGYADKGLNFAVLNAIVNQINLIRINNMIIYTDNQKYYNYLKDIFSDNNIKLVELNKIKTEIKKDNINRIWTPDPISTIKIKLKLLLNNIELITWYQGIIPEENYLKYNSKIKFIILSIIEYISLIVSDKKIFVSESMYKFYSYKYKLKDINYFIVPCISDISYNNINKIPNSYAYVGGMSEWQCVDQILEYYSKSIQDKDSKLYIITRDIDIAKEKIQKYKIINYELKAIDNRKDMEIFLSQMEYGFLFRDSISVNKVSSPIKFAEYLSCGVKLIMTDAIPHYKDIIQQNNIGIVVNDSNSSFNKLNIEVNKIISIYHKYFNKNILIKNYTNFIKNEFNKIT